MELHAKNLDVKCLRCGMFNIPENKICGNCGASLPIVYDEEGKPFTPVQLSEQYFPKPKTKGGVPAGVNRTRWIFRAIILLAALWVAYQVLHLHH